MLQPQKPKSTPKGAVTVAAFPLGRDRDAAMVGMCQAGLEKHLTKAGHQGGGCSCPQPNKPADGYGLSGTCHWLSARTAAVQDGLHREQNHFVSPILQPFFQHTAQSSVWAALGPKHTSAYSSATALRTVLLVSTIARSVLAGARAFLLG